MTVAFAGLVAALIAERISVTAGVRWLVPLLLIGVSSPVHWYLTELKCLGDLLFYDVVYLCYFLCMPLLYCRQSLRNLRPPDLRRESPGERPHTQAPRRFTFRILDSPYVALARTVEPVLEPSCQPIVAAPPCCLRSSLCGILCWLIAPRIRSCEVCHAVPSRCIEKRSFVCASRRR